MLWNRPLLLRRPPAEQVASLLGSLGEFNAGKQRPDDLKKIKGIGPQMEQTLNQIGIYTYAQVARMGQSDYELLDSITGAFPGRARRDDWAGQAKQLNSNN